MVPMGLRYSVVNSGFLRNSRPTMIPANMPINILAARDSFFFDFSIS